ncbi:hypothetical protein H181DRAFT_04413 [Streptomyces sp. WMMB 714]|nr:hypothetical protein H181DRAFT_04413 [Streptomyces sp. WMMB 714]
MRGASVRNTGSSECAGVVQAAATALQFEDRLLTH